MQTRVYQWYTLDADHIEWYNGQFILLYKKLSQTLDLHVCTWQLSFHGPGRSMHVLLCMHNLRDLTSLSNVCLCLWYLVVLAICELQMCAFACMFTMCVCGIVCVHVLSLVHNIFACVALQPDVHAWKHMLQCKNSVFLCCIATCVQIILYALPVMTQATIQCAANNLIVHIMLCHWALQNFCQEIHACNHTNWN